MGRSYKIVALDDGHAAILYASGEDIYLQQFNATGGEVGAAMQVNESSHDISNIEMQRLADGSLFVTWVDESETDTDGSGIYGRRLSDDGSPLTQEHLLNRRYQGNQFLPNMIQSKNGPLYAYWTSTYSDKESIQVTQVGVNQISTKPNSYTLVGRVIPSSRDDEDLVFSLADDAGGRFVVFSDGSIKVKDRNLINYQADQQHTIRVQVSDGDTATEHDFSIQVIP